MEITKHNFKDNDRHNILINKYLTNKINKNELIELVDLLLLGLNYNLQQIKKFKYNNLL